MQAGFLSLCGCNNKWHDTTLNQDVHYILTCHLPSLELVCWQYIMVWYTLFLMKKIKIKLTHYHFSNTNHNVAEYNLSVHLLCH
jgi:hypothetical protein